MYNYKQRNLSSLFEQSAEFLDKLASAYASDSEDKGFELDFNPKGCQSAILIPLMLMGKVAIIFSLCAKQAC